jgi:hypothetical protein
LSRLGADQSQIELEQDKLREIMPVIPAGVEVFCSALSKTCKITAIYAGQSDPQEFVLVEASIGRLLLQSCYRIDCKYWDFVSICENVCDICPNLPPLFRLDKKQQGFGKRR